MVLLAAPSSMFACSSLDKLPTGSVAISLLVVIWLSVFYLTSKTEYVPQVKMFIAIAISILAVPLLFAAEFHVAWTAC